MFSFCKFHGFGNDYIVFEADELKSIFDLSDFARRVCQRNTGVGGDGIAVLDTSKTADFLCRIINPDGSEAAFSGNGTRCAVAYLYYKNLWRENLLRLETKSGVKIYELLEQSDAAFRFRAELGKPSSIKNYELKIKNYDGDLKIIELNVGNPVAVVFVEDFGAFDWRIVGKELETHEHFPERTNVVFVKILDRETVEIRIWERGAGETSSSGTCSIAAAVASVFAGKTNRKVDVRAPGGTTEAEWRGTDDEMLITGRADLAFCGEWSENKILQNPAK